MIRIPGNINRVNRREQYERFLRDKTHAYDECGFEPAWMPDWLFDFQKSLVDYAVRKGRSAIFADCGLGKTPLQLVWAQNVVSHTNKSVLILTPLAVSHQTIREAEKFGIAAARSNDGTVQAKITVTNYERLEKFNLNDFVGVVCDESSILKNFDGRRKAEITEFMRTRPYRLLCTATAAPNDYFELGTSSEALGYLGYQDMLTRFFKLDDTKYEVFGWGRPKYRFRGHAEKPFWRWVCSWARVCRRPSDLGFDDGDFVLPELSEHEHIVENTTPRDGMLFSTPARSLREQREERRVTLRERCEFAAELVAKHNGSSVIWCHLNPEGDMLEKIIPDALQVSGSMPDEKKEERLLAFQNGELRVLVIKPKIGAFGLNWQHCHNVVTFPSHSFEQYYQSVRRCWRFGQKHPVTVHIITTEGELGVMRNLQRKAKQADRMFESLTQHVNNELRLSQTDNFVQKEEVPAWL